MTGNDQVYNPPGKPDLHFEANYYTVIAGATILLKWKVTGADNVTVNGRKVTPEGEQEEIVQENSKFKLVAHGKGLFASYKKVLPIKLADPGIEQVRIPSTLIREDVPVVVDFTLKNCSHWELQATYLTGSKKPEVAASGKNTALQSIWREQASAYLKAACSIILVAYNGKKEMESRPYLLDTGKPTILSFTADKLIIPAGKAVRLAWHVCYARKVMIQPGNHEVTDTNFLDYKPEGIHDVEVSITVYGDFNEKVSQSLKICIAWLGNIRKTNNGNAGNPEFFLGWDSAYVEHVTLNPGAIAVSPTATRHPIPAKDETDEYYLQGATITGDEVKHSFSLHAADILFFEASRTAAIAGTKLYLRWRAMNARKVMLDHGIGNQTGQEEVSITMKPGMERITITVWGDINVVQQSILIPLMKGPEIVKIKMPVPDLKITLSVKRPFIPQQVSTPHTALQLTQQHKKIHPVVQKLLLPSSTTTALFTRFKKITKKRRHIDHGRLMGRLRQHLVWLQDECRNLFKQIKPK